MLAGAIVDEWANFVNPTTVLLDEIQSVTTVVG